MFVIDVPYINLDQIYNSGQAPRWIKLKDMKYVIPHKDKALKIEQVKERLIMSCTEEDFFNIWFYYLDLGTDYLDVNGRVKRQNRKFKIPANRGNGIHVLRPEFFETYVFSKLIEYVGYAKAGELMNRIAMTYGIEHRQMMREAGRITWYEWPTPEAMFEKLQKERPKTKVKRFLFNLCDAIVNQDYAYTHNGNDIFNLIGKHDLDVFPTIGIENTIEKNFKCDVEWFDAEYLDGLSDKGVCYMYILHHIMNPPKEVTGCGIGR